ncbi:hypothetical protein LCI18_012700 [Fusarium solani-melongenae]|uniref:Uncharacterized protein n=1 Tax=Fusarium solani subsp. cucurbitae TaxID=2747967 RepID=A0ACD3ZKJ4_FUSSC|nr:hypothetical protein LCI18_012700 [Fusarium solani-melongenae]
MAIDWKLYERDVNRWYLDEGKTANDVIRLLLENYNLVVTPRQFKAKFNGCKKISSKEWSILIPKIREREANGLKSVIYVCGKAIKQESVARSIRRYSKLCRDGSQSDTAIDLGIETVGQHRIEIRAPSEPETQLLRDLGTDDIQPIREGENSSSSQRDEPDVDEEFGLVEMDVEPGVLASAETAIYPSPSMFLRSLDQFPPEVLESLSFSGTNEMQMESGETALPSSPWFPLSPSIDLTTLLPLQPTFTSFWSFPVIFSLTLKGCKAAVDIAKRIGISVPDDSRHQFLPSLNISPAQTEVFKPIIHSIEELLALPKPKFPGMQRTRLEGRAQINFSPNLLDIVQGHSLAQALSVIVYMISNNLLDEEESFLLICWILKKGHAPTLLTFSRLPAVNHLAFGSAFLRTMSKAADRLLPSSTEAISLIGDFVSSREFLCLVKSHHEDMSGPLGTNLFRLAIQTDSMELAKVLGSHGVDRRSDSVYPVLLLAVHWGRHSMLELIIRLGVNVSQGSFGGRALESAIVIHDHVAAQTLLDAGTLIPDGALFGFTSRRNADIRALLRKSLRHDSRFVCWELFIAAEKGNVELSRVSVAYGVVSSQVLEQAMCLSIEYNNLPSTRAFLKRGVDPNVGMPAFRNRLRALKEYATSILVESDTLYLLLQEGAQVCGETALSVQRYLDSPNSNYFDNSLLLRVLLDAGYDETWVHQYLLTSYAKQGSIFECDACINAGTPINGYGIRGQSALSAAAGEGHLALVQHLISRGAAPNLPPSSDHTDGKSALYVALSEGHWEVAAYLIDSGSDATTKATTTGFTFLEAVVVNSARDDKRIADVNTNFRKLRALGAPVHRHNSTNSFLLHKLISTDQLECLELALRAGARTEDKYEGMTPIQLAVLQKDSEAIRSLLRYGANINGCPRPVGGNTMIPEMLSPSPIRLQDIHEYREATKRMLFSHVDSSGFLMGVFANKEPYFPHTPLQLASSCHEPDLGIVEFLLNQGADVNSPAAEWHGRTALQGATSAKKLNMDVVQLLLDRRAEVNAPPAQVGGVTALQAAAIRGDIQLVRLLLDKGANINAPGAPHEGRTALEGAAEHGRMEMLRFLLSKKAIPDLVTGYSRAIELAEKELHIGIAKFLREEQCRLHRAGWGLGSLEFDFQSL